MGDDPEGGGEPRGSRCVERKVVGTTAIVDDQRLGRCSKRRKGDRIACSKGSERDAGMVRSERRVGRHEHRDSSYIRCCAHLVHSNRNRPGE